LQLQRLLVADFVDVDLGSVAPNLRHLSCTEEALPRLRAGLQRSQIDSLDLNCGAEAFASFAADLGAAVGSQCSRLVFHMCDFDDDSLLLACGAVPRLDLAGYGMDMAHRMNMCLRTLTERGCAVRHLVLNLDQGNEPTAEQLRPLARWPCLQRLSIHGWAACDVSALAADCLTQGSPLTRIDLHVIIIAGAPPCWVQACEVCAGVERANPAITCVAHRVAER
jgi:hypothetical protein